MAIKHVERQNGGDDVVTVACPACGLPRDEMERGALPFHLQNCPERENL